MSEQMRDRSTPTYILGGYQTDFAKVWSRHGQDLSDMTREATLGALQASGYTTGEIPAHGDALMARLAEGVTHNLDANDYRCVGQSLTMSDYLAAFEALPAGRQAEVNALWGPPEQDPMLRSVIVAMTILDADPDIDVVDLGTRPSVRLPMVLPTLQVAGRALGTVFGSTGLGRDIPDALRILADLPEPTASSAFTRTLRSVVDWRGQVVTMLDRCYLTESVPVQLIWGDQDAMIPVSHARMAHSAMPGSRLEIFSRSGHFPFHDDPDRFVEVVERFIDDTVPAEYDQAVLRELLRHGVSERAVSGSLDTRVAVFDAIDTDERSAT